MDEPRSPDPGGPWPDLRATYDQVAAEYADAFADEMAAKPFDRAVLDRFTYQVGAGGRVADLGCGPAAQVGAYLAGHGLRVIGLDLSPRCALHASGLTGLPAVAGDLMCLPLGPGTLDGAVSFYALIHLPRARVPGALAQLGTALVPGGRLVLAVHGGEGEIERHGWFGYDVTFRATLFGREEVQTLLSEAGFTDVRVATRAPYPQEHPTTRLYATARRPGTARESAGSGRSRTA